ncbi:MAG: hypothetical protein EOM61_10460 [Bacteroidia bacterium]|nr:hypothetical protein [Bacteroidia bacterium]
MIKINILFMPHDEILSYINSGYRCPVHWQVEEVTELFNCPFCITPAQCLKIISQIPFTQTTFNHFNRLRCYPDFHHSQKTGYYCVSIIKGCFTLSAQPCRYLSQQINPCHLLTWHI